jgi:hypothetical protein
MRKVAETSVHVRFLERHFRRDWRDDVTARRTDALSPALGCTGRSWQIRQHAVGCACRHCGVPVVLSPARDHKSLPPAFYIFVPRNLQKPIRFNDRFPAEVPLQNTACGSRDGTHGRPSTQGLPRALLCSISSEWEERGSMARPAGTRSGHFSMRERKGRSGEVASHTHEMKPHGG